MANLLTFAIIQSKLNLPSNIQAVIENYIEIIEKIKVEKLIGKELFDKIKAGDYATLKDYVNNVTIYWTYDKYLREGNSINTSFGAIQKNSDYGINEKYERQLKLDSNLTTAHFFERELYDFLTLNADDYPEWNDTTNKNQVPYVNIYAGKRSNYDPNN